jgi:hypothetical protein
MNKFLSAIMSSNGYNRINNTPLELFGNKHEFFLIQCFEMEEIQDFFKTVKLDYLISEFQKLDDEKIKKNTSLFILIKVYDIHQFYNNYLNTIVAIEEDEYYFRKYIIFYTDEGLNDLNPDVQYLLHIVQNNIDDLEESLFDKFEKNMFFDDSYFIAMQLIIKLPFISLPHSDKPFATIEDKIKLRMESEQQVKKEQQVNQILEWFDSDNIREQLENSDIFDNLRQILEE